MIHVYIDESGAFIPLERRKSKVSGVVALFCSSRVINDMLAEFTRLARSFPASHGEVKGSRLNEGQVAAVIALVEKYDGLVEAQVIDSGWHKDRDLLAFRMKQADNIGRHAAKNPDGKIRELAARLQANVEAMSNQLFMQAWMMFPLVERVMQTAIWYYSLNAPRELGGFDWTVDAKEAGGMTAAEDFWTKFVVPYAQNHMKPLRLLPDGDHSALESLMTVDPEGKTGLSIPGVLTDHLAFKDSASECGLQLVDIIASAITRAFNGTLGEAGWHRLPYLLAGTESQVIQYGRMVLRKRGDRRIPICGQHEEIMQRLSAKRLLVYQDKARQIRPVAW
jgi:hypothetical protein